MTPITFKQFLSLVERADRIEIDTNNVEHHSVIDDGRGIIFSWSDDEFLGYEVNVDDDKEFFFDSKLGQVTFNDSDGIKTEVNFYIEFPLTEIPA
jgi:hypothetical protein